MHSYSLRVGNVEMVSLTDGAMRPSPTDVFPDTDIPTWKSEFPDLLDNDDNISLRLGALAVRSNGKLLIVDTGMQMPDGSATLITDMNNKGIDRDAVELVVITHLHPDHVGWNLTNGQPTFPNASYLIPETDWIYWTQPNILAESQHIQDQVMPLEKLNVLHLIGSDFNITNELKTVATPGHTPGHVSIAISSGGENAFILGDVAHSPAQAHRTEWNPGFDINGEISRETRRLTIDQLESNNVIVSAGHFPNPGFGRFTRDNGIRIWDPILER